MNMFCNSRASASLLGPSQRGALSDFVGHTPMKLALGMKEPGA